jgi:hypothetical protein
MTASNYFFRHFLSMLNVGWLGSNIQCEDWLLTTALKLLT